jgi:hypothetical protein
MLNAKSGQFNVKIELPLQQADGVTEHIAMRMYPKDVTPECFNRVFSSGLAWILDRSMRE